MIELWRKRRVMLAIGACGWGMQSPALAGSYTYTLLVAPGAVPGRTLVAGIGPDSGAVGSFYDAGGASHGFVWHRSPRPKARGFYTQIDVPGGSNTQLLGISPNGVAVGTFVAPGTSGQTLFTYNVAKRTFDTAITGRSDLSLDTAVINRAGVIVGQAHTGDFDLFAYEVRGGTYRQTRRPAGSQSFYWSTAINTTGLAGGTYFGTTAAHAYTFDHGLTRAVSVPGGSATYSVVTSVTDAGAVIGSYAMPTGDEFGFVASGSSVSSFGFPGAKYTQLAGQTAAGALVGTYSSASPPQEGFVLFNGAYSVMTLPYPHLEDVALDHVNASGSAVGTVYVPGRQFPFVAYCAADQVPCTH